jgi:hypothetical protein
MAENKKSFILYADISATVDNLPLEAKGALFQMIVDYVNDRNPSTEDLLLKVAFEPIKSKLKRDLVKWEEIKEKRSKAGKKSAEQKQHMSTHVECVEQNEQVSTVNVNDNVNVSVINDFNNKPTAEEFGELPDIKINSAIQLIKITKGQDVAAEKITGMWGVFKAQNLTGQKYYADVGAVHSHFINWIKGQKFENATGLSKNNQQLGTSSARMEAAKKW